MNENKGKVKEFVKEHKKEILIGSGLAVLGGIIGWNANMLKVKIGFAIICRMYQSNQKT